MNAETASSLPSYVIFQMGTRRFALPRQSVGELIASPTLDSFPHTTHGIAGVVIRRGRILPVLDLGPAVLGSPLPPTRFFLVVERNISNSRETCAIPVQGACELASGIVLPGADPDSVATGYLDLDGEEIDVLDLEKAIASNSACTVDTPAAQEALS